MKTYSRVILALAAPVAAGLLLSSCGGDKGTSATATSGQGSVAQAAENPTTEVPATSQTGGGAQPSQAASSDSTKQLSIHELPPDIAVGPVDSLVSPGQAVELTVEGTPDVTEMSLSDGHNDSQAFYYESADKIWKVVYRVPLRPKSERIGLAVTARTDANRWRRVWVFLNVRSETDSKVEKAGS